MESTLSLKLSDLAGAVGHFLGYGRGADNSENTWTTRQQADINQCLASGLREFYFPQVTEQSGHTYEWSFLCPVISLTLASGASTATLPDDFGSVKSEVSVIISTGNNTCALPIVGEGLVRHAFARFPDATGQPEMVSVQPIKGTGNTKGQRFQLYVYPTSDQAYTLSFAYSILPDFLTTAHPYPYGGMAHAQTLQEACLSAAEALMDDMQGVHKALFNERLTASIGADKRLKPNLLGYNGDMSDGPYYDSATERHLNARVTFNGVLYGS